MLKYHFLPSIGIECKHYGNQCQQAGRLHRNACQEYGFNLFAPSCKVKSYKEIMEIVENFHIFRVLSFFEKL